MIYFDNAATGGVKPKSVISAVKFALENYSANPGRSGHSLSVNTADMVYKAREKSARFFGAEGAETVVFTQNCTQAINFVLKGILRRGDHVIVSSLEHNAVMRPLVKIGVNYSIAEVSATDDNETVKNFSNLIKPNTKLVFCTGASNVTGKILPISRIGELCRKQGIFFGVDAAQIAGVADIDMKRQNIDFLCVAPHKGLGAPMGIGILIARKNIPQTILEGGTGTNSIEFIQPDSLPEKLESGTINVPAIAGVSAGIEHISKAGIRRIYLHELGLIQHLYKEIEKRKKIKLYTPFPKMDSYAPLLVFNLEGTDSFKLANMLSNEGIATRGGLHCAPLAHKQIGTPQSGAVRVSAGYFNTMEEINRFLRVIDTKILKKT